jgi:predicted Zn-dependent peptidase
MKKLLVLISLMLVVGCARSSDIFFKPMTPVVKKLPNGMEIFTLEDREFPIAELFLYIKGGSVYDPVGKEGLASVAMQSLRLGGTSSMTPDQVEENLESVGAAVETGTSPEYSSAALSALKKDFTPSLKVLTDLLKNPRIDAARFEIVKQRAIEALRREREDPLAFSFREFPPFVYGKESAWGRKTTVESLQRITLQDVKRFVAEFMHPDRVIAAFAGDFSADEIAKKMEIFTADWKRSEKPLPSLPPVIESFEKGLEVFPQKGLTQSTIVMGHLGTTRDNPDKFPLLVLNFILGGGNSLTSRLGEEIRSSAGKAYGVWSDFSFGKEDGLFRAAAQTALENTDWVVAKMQEIIRQTAESPKFSEEEVSRAKRSILRSLVFDFETRFSQVKQLALFHLWGYPDDYLERYQKEIGKVSVKDLQRVAKKYLHPDGLKIVIVTKETKK